MNTINIFKLVLPVLTVFFLLTISERRIFAQTGRAASIQRRVDELNRQGEQYEREQLKADLKGRPNKPADRKRVQARAAEVEQDFNNLQASYNKIVLAMAKAGFAYESVSGAMSEITKCSTRLKQNLALPQPTDAPETQQQPDSERIEGLLLELRKHIYSFVTNPLFESQGVLNVEQAKNASSDLEKIIELSKLIRRNGDRLREGSKPNADEAKPET